MRIGLSFWGFLGDFKEDMLGNELSTPDGNATYSWSLIWEAQRRGHTVYAMQEDRDWPAFCRHGKYDFQAFSQSKRMDAYLRMLNTHGQDFPELDVLILEWRFPIPGRNTGLPKDHSDYQPDLDRQSKLLEHYKGTKTKVVVWDLDHKLTEEDEKCWLPDAIFETSHSPRELFIKRTRVEPPTLVSELLQHPLAPLDPKRKLAYVGSRYERDDVIEALVKPVSERFPGEVEFFGNWTREPNFSECRRMWPYVKYFGRITTRGFRAAYSSAVAVPLLAKKSYFETGFITPRPWEALIFGSLPVGFWEHRGITQYVIAGHVVGDAVELGDLLEEMSKYDDATREDCRRRQAELLERCDASHFLDKVEAVLEQTGPEVNPNRVVEA